jgi:hypothetical protein
MDQILVDILGPVPHARILRNYSRDETAIRILATMAPDQMTPEECRACINYLISQSDTLQDLEEVLENELGITNCRIDWEPPRNDRESDALAKVPGGPTSRNGAHVRVTVPRRL